MPIFEYKCKKCGKEFEELVRNSEEKVCCPKCESPKVNKKMSVFAHKSSGKFHSSSASGGCHSCHSGSCTTCGKG
jgi:putative FmdB family regulatory protein